MEDKNIMSSVKVVAIVALCVLGAAVLLSAAPNQFGIANSREVTFDNPVRIGQVLLPKGDYTILHTMEGETHIMVFKQQHTKHPAEARVQCSLQPLTSKAPRSEKTYLLNASNERVLHELIFKGDTAKHVFNQ